MRFKDNRTEPKYCEFKALDRGCPFEFGHEFFIKIDARNSAVNIYSGNVEHFEEGDIVKIINAKMIIENY